MKRNMKRGLVVVMLLWAVLTPLFALPVAHAQLGGSCALGTLIPMGFETITVSSTAVGFTAGTIRSGTSVATYAVGYVAADNIRYRDDAVDPTASVGMLVASGSNFQVCGMKAVSQFRMIRQTTDATVSVSYYRSE